MADPESNRNLKVVLERAKTYRVPKNIIDRAIEKAKGGSEENYDELRYEGFGVSGTMVIIDTLTNNVNLKIEIRDWNFFHAPDLVYNPKTRASLLSRFY